MSDTLASILKRAEEHGVLQRKVVKGGETEYLPTHPGEASTANKAAVIPPKPVQQAAALGLELRRQFGRGGTEIGVARARDLSNGRAVSEDTLARMRSYFARHAVDAQADGWKDEANPSAGWIAWLLWGGDEGRDWVEGMLSDAEKQLTFFQAEKQHTGAMLALYPDTPPQFSLADSDLTPTAPDELHVTMAYLGDAADLDEEDRAFLRRVCKQIASEFSSIQAKLGGIGRFLNLEDDDTQAYYASVDSPDIEALRARLVEVLGALGLLPDSDHGFTPHITLAYVPVGKPAAGAGLQEEPVEFGGLSLSLAGERQDFPFSGNGAKYSPGQPRDEAGRFGSGLGGGGGPSGGGVTSQAKIEQATRETEDKTQAYGKRTGREMVSVILDDGTVLSATGSTDRAETPEFAGHAQVMIHNHPSNASFTGKDFFVLAENDVDSSVVVGHNGSRFELRKGPNYKYVPHADQIWGDELASRITESVGVKLTDDVARATAKRLGLEYTSHIVGKKNTEEDDKAIEIMLLGAKQNIMLTYPDENKTQRFVWQQHFRGKSSHGDFRVQSGDYLVGWTIPDQNPGAITEPVETLAQATSAVNNPDLWKMNLKTGEIKPREIRSGVVRKGDLRALPKGVEIPEDWLNEQGVTDKPDPGEAIPVGATRNFPGVFKIVDKGTVEHGAKKPWLAEYWIHGDKWGTQRWLFRLLERGKGNPSQPRDEFGRWSSTGARSADVPQLKIHEAAFGPGPDRDARRAAGLFDVVSETDPETAKVIVSQGVEPTFKPEILDPESGAPGQGLERAGLYVANEEAFSKGTFGGVRVYLTAEREGLKSPEEARRLGRLNIDDNLQSETGAVTNGRMSKKAISKVEVYENGKWKSLSPEKFLEENGVKSDFPMLPSVPEFKSRVAAQAKQLFLSDSQVDDLAHDYNRAGLGEKRFLAEDAGAM